MAQTVTYDGDVLTIARLDEAQGGPEWVESADHGNIGQSTMTLDDVAGTQATFGHKLVTVEEDDCAVVRTLTGYVGQRKFRRGSGKTGGSRVIEVPILDLNARLGFKPMWSRHAKRPKESVGDRLTYLLGSSFLSGLVSDFGFVDYPTKEVDKYDLRGQFPLDCIRELALAVGYNYFVYWSDDDDGAGLWFNDSNSSTDFTCTLSFSSVLSDIDNDTCFEVGDADELTRDPSEVISSVLIPFKNGFIRRTRAATETTYEPRGGVAPSASVVHRSKAVALGDRYLFARRNEEDTITAKVTLPATKINLVKAGMRAQFRYEWMGPEGYGESTWFRITETRKKPLIAPDEQLYTCTMTLSPQEDTPASAALVQCASTVSAGETTVTMDSPVTIGNLLISRLIHRNDETIPTMFDGSWTLLASGAATGGTAPGSGGLTHGAVAMYGKIATSTSQIIDREASAEQMQMTVCEISGRTLGDVTAFSLDHGTGSTWSPGSGSGRIGLFAIAVPRGTDQARQGYTITPTDAWTVEMNQDIDREDACNNPPADPWCWWAKIEGATSIDLTVSVAATGGVGPCAGQSLTEWCAAAVFV